MKAPACGSRNAKIFLSEEAEDDGLRIFSVQTTSPGFPGYETPLEIVNAGRTKAPGCPAHLSVGSASKCATTVARVAGEDSPGAQEWVFEDAGKSKDGNRLVFIFSEVSKRLVCVSARCKYICFAMLTVFPAPPHRPETAARSATWAPAPPSAKTQRYRSTQRRMIALG